MRKILLLDDVFPTGEQSVQPVLRCGPGRQDLSRITKTASEALDYIKNVTPEPGKTHLLVLALGAEEAYGPNRNGDGFPEFPVPAKGSQGGYWVAPGEELTKHYQSFERGHAFKHHVNKDPAKASGVVKKAFWNGRMRRVELLIVLDNEKDPEWVQRVNDGDAVPVSMGCKIRADFCSICGNKAPTRAQYCDHAKFQMNEILPDGRKVYVHNPSPNFFDISRVIRPADRTGYTLKKVAAAYELRSSAELGEVVDGIDRKSAAIRKLSDIDKIVRGEAVASSSNLAPAEQLLIKNFRDYAAPRVQASPDLPMDELLKHSTVTTLSTLTQVGILLKDAEFLELMGSTLAGRRLHLPPSVLSKAAALMPHVYELFEASPALCEDVLATGVLDARPEKVSAALEAWLEPFRVKRAYAGEMLYRRLVPEGADLRPDGAPTTDLLSWTDPRTGQTHQTTRGAAIDAQDATTRAHLRKVLGGSALMLGGYKLLSAFPSMRPFKVPLALGAGALGYGQLKKRPGQLMQSDEGFDAPTMTEFAAKAANENLPGIVIHLLEGHGRCGATPSSAKAAAALSAVKTGGVIDDVRGLELDLDVVATALGELIYS
jgi:hypothetical protein